MSAAKVLAGRFGCPRIYNIAELNRNDYIFAGYDRVIVVYPSYAYGMPVAVRRFFKAADIHKDSYVAALVTFGSKQGGALAEAKRLLKRRGIKLAYARGIPAVENFIPIFGPPSEKTLDTRTAAQEKAVEEISADIENGERRDVRGISVLPKTVSVLFRLARPLIVKFYHVEDSCTGCGLCQKVCPAHAIKIAGGRPEFCGDCELCQACINWCPQRAISFLKVKPGTARYTNKQVAVREFLLKSNAQGEPAEDFIGEPAAETV